MKVDIIKLKDNAWNALQEADKEKHDKQISVKTENGKVVEVRVRRSRGEEYVAKVFVKGVQVLPMDIAAFEQAFENYELEFKEF